MVSSMYEKSSISAGDQTDNSSQDSPSKDHLHGGGEHTPSTGILRVSSNESFQVTNAQVIC